MTRLSLSAADRPELVAQTREEYDGAFATLVQRYQPIVFRWAMGLSGDADEADDVTQEVFVRVHRKLPSYRGDGPFDAWLYRITRRVALRMRPASRLPSNGGADDVYITDPGARIDSPDDPRHPSMLQGVTGMNCDNYLSMLATLPVDELTYGGAREHAAQCRDCDRVARVVVECERNMLMAFGDAQSSVPAAQVAAHAVVTSRRRAFAIYCRIAVGVATAASILYFVASRQEAAPAHGDMIRSVFSLRCARCCGLCRPHRERNETVDRARGIGGAGL